MKKGARVALEQLVAWSLVLGGPIAVSRAWKYFRGADAGDRPIETQTIYVRIEETYPMPPGMRRGP